jgi:phosphate-selective porin OprO and OprP
LISAIGGIGLLFRPPAIYRHDSFTTPGLGTGNGWGYYSQAGFYLIPRKLEVTGRISGVDFDKLNVAGVFKKTTAYTGGLNYYFHEHNFKLQMDYSFLDNSAFKGQPSASNNHRLRLQTQFLF